MSTSTHQNDLTWWVEEVHIEKIKVVTFNLLNRTLRLTTGLFGDLRSSFRTGEDTSAIGGFSSGSSVHKKTRFSKQGRRELWSCLYMPAVVAMNYNPVVRSLKGRLNDRRLANKAIIVAAMRKLLHIVYGVLKSQTPFDA